MLWRKLCNMSIALSLTTMCTLEVTKFPWNVGTASPISEQECKNSTFQTTKVSKFIIVNNKKNSGETSPKPKRLFTGPTKTSTCLWKATTWSSGGESAKTLIDSKVINILFQDEPMKLFSQTMTWPIWTSASEIVMVTVMALIKIGGLSILISTPKSQELMWLVLKFVCGVKSPTPTISKPKSGSEPAPWPKSFGSALCPSVPNSPTSPPDSTLKAKDSDLEDLRYHQSQLGYAKRICQSASVDLIEIKDNYLILPGDHENYWKIR